MKKIYILAVFAYALCTAQPVINPSQLMLNLDSEAYFAEVESFDPGPAGPNRNWTLTNLDLINIGTSTTISPVGTTFESTFPTANYCSATTGLFQGGFSYFRYDNQKMELLGEAFTGLGIFSYDPNPRTYIEFPYTYNKVINDTYHADNIAFTTTYDGYGSLTVPFGTYHNVIRQKIEEEGTTHYIWFNVSPFFPIAQTTEGGIGLMRNAAILSANQFTPAAAISVWPNPSRDIFRIEGISTLDGCSVSNLRGQTVWQNASGNNTVIDLSHCAPGIYMLQIVQNGNTSIHKILKY